MDISTGVVGLLASIMSMVIGLPQAVNVWKFKNDPERLAGISGLAQYMMIGSGALWVAYADMTHSFWVAASVMTSVPLALFTLAILSRSRRMTWTSVEMDAEIDALLDDADIEFEGEPVFGLRLAA